MKKVPVILTGFGHVGRAAFTLFSEKRPAVRERYGIEIEIMAVMKADGAFHTGERLELGRISRGGALWTADNPAWHAGLPIADLIRPLGKGGCLVDCTPSNLPSGEPGLTYLLGALESGWNVATAGKAALVTAFGRLRALAAENGLALKFSGATAAALPTVDVGVISLAGTRIEGIQGILNGTSNYVLTRMAEGLGYESALDVARSHGIAEPDPSYDVDGWDSAAKLVLIANACLDQEFGLNDVRIAGISGLPADFVREARREGKSVKLLAAASPSGKGRAWNLEVQPSLLDPAHPLFHVEGTEKGITFLTDTMGSVTVTGGRSNPRGAAAALLKDLINIYYS